MLAALLISTASSTAFAEQSARLLVDVDVLPSGRISSTGEGPFFWYAVRVDPADHNHLALCALRNRPEQARALDAVLYLSRDGGKTWTLAKSVSDGSYSSEADCAFGPGSSLFFTASYQFGPEADVVQRNVGKLFRSDNFGKTWVASANLDYLDSAVLVPQPDTNTLVVGVDYPKPRAVIATSRNLQAITTRDFKLRSNLQSGLNDHSTSGVVLPDGATGILFIGPDPSPGQPLDISLVRLGKDHAPEVPIVIAQTASRDPTGDAGEPDFENTPGHPVIATGRLPDRDGQRVYASWTDRRDGRARVMLAMSDDSGASWTAPRVADDAPATQKTDRGNAASHPSLAVNASGILAIQWAEKNGRCWRIAVSGDGGDTFKPSVALNGCRATPFDTASIAPYLRPAAGGSATSGEPFQFATRDWRSYWAISRTSALAAAGEEFVAVWAALGFDHEALSSARISVRTRSYPIGCDRVLGPAASAISGYQKLGFNAATQTLSMDVRLVFPARDAGRWPVVFEASRLNSPFGTLIPLNADMAISAEMPRWRFNRAVSPNDLPRLGPRAGFDVSETRRLEFKLTRFPQPTAYSLGHDPTFSVAGRLFEHCANVPER